VTILAEQSGCFELAQLMSCYVRLTKWLDAMRLLGVRRECRVAGAMPGALLLQCISKGVRREGFPVEQLQ
jgi:hypothetical protein